MQNFGRENFDDQHPFIKFIRLFHRQSFTLYGTSNIYNNYFILTLAGKLKANMYNKAKVGMKSCSFNFVLYQAMVMVSNDYIHYYSQCWLVDDPHLVSLH